MMHEIKIVGTWEKNYIAEDIVHALQMAKDEAMLYPHLNMKSVGVVHLRELEKDENSGK
jgi:hypothetical protein